MTQTSNLPSGPIKKVIGTCIYLPGNDIDTDRIIPARFLKCVNFEALGNQVFFDDRQESDQVHPFDNKKNKSGSILIVDKNFGCGSSREHAPQSLMRWGIRAIIGQSFAEIFYGNCISIGIPCATISEKNITSLINKINDSNQLEFTLDIHLQKFYTEQNSWDIKIEAASMQMLLSGAWDATSTLIKQKEKIISTMNSLPYINSFRS